MSSEPELGKEPPVLASLKTFLKLRLSFLESSDLLVLLRKSLEGSDFLEINVEGVTGRHQMLVVNDLDTRDFFAVFLVESLRMTLLGYFLSPATRQCP
ncbi:hypothetical protein DY000_02060711 [Brassica cretica]|uniref:Uncharacterized protein n=1 Tax=Brassica cretica TaxID=69181 RepID=A0ABQ7B0J5_BRACR|nr:hypothetical protein DY000_02060711 [Brassica cretica]